MENHSSVTGWQRLFFSYKSFYFSAAVAIATFEIYGGKFIGYLILIVSGAGRRDEPLRTSAWGATSVVAA